MPNIKSAKKRVKTSALKREQNRSEKASMRTAIKKAKTEIKNGNKSAIDENVKVAIKKIDKAIAGGLIHKNKAARDKSKLMKSANKVK